MTQVILINNLGEHTISEDVFWSKISDTHFPLWGNGLVDTGESKQPTQKGDCLYTAAILATERYSQVVDAVEYETQFLKQGTINQLKKIVQHFYDPARSTEHANSGIYSVRRATLLGQLLQCPLSNRVRSLRKEYGKRCAAPSRAPRHLRVVPPDEKGHPSVSPGGRATGAGSQPCPCQMSGYSIECRTILQNLSTQRPLYAAPGGVTPRHGSSYLTKIPRYMAVEETLRVSWTQNKRTAN